jgi:methyltransferase
VEVGVIPTNLAAHYEVTIRTYFEGCNEADVEKMESCFVPDAVHYFPPGAYGGAWRGGRLIAERYAGFVHSKGSAWTIDRMIVDAASHQAVIEWTHYKTADDVILRGDEWYLFDADTGLIAEIRAYYAAPIDPSRRVLELEDFDYSARGYHLESPIVRPIQTGAASPTTDPPIGQSQRK